MAAAGAREEATVAAAADGMDSSRTADADSAIAPGAASAEAVGAATRSTRVASATCQ